MKLQLENDKLQDELKKAEIEVANAKIARNIVFLKMFTPALEASSSRHKGNESHKNNFEGHTTSGGGGENHGGGNNKK